MHRKTVCLYWIRPFGRPCVLSWRTRLDFERISSEIFPLVILSFHEIVLRNIFTLFSHRVLTPGCNYSAFLAYVFADAHLNPNVCLPVNPFSDSHLGKQFQIYTEPLKFDPDRFSPAISEEKKAPHAYLAWGSGRHPRPGSRVCRIFVTVLLTHTDTFIPDRKAGA